MKNKRQNWSGFCHRGGLILFSLLFLVYLSGGLLVNAQDIETSATPTLTLTLPGPSPSATISPTLLIKMAAPSTPTPVQGFTQSPSQTITPTPTHVTPTATLEPSATHLSQKELVPNGIYVPGEVWVQMRRDSNLKQPGLSVQGMNIEENAAAVLAKLGIFRINVGNLDAREAAAALKNQDGVVAAEPDYLVSAQEIIPNDSGFNLQYGLINIRAPQAWSITTGAPVVIAIVDSGVDLHHPDLGSKIIQGIDFVNNDNIADDDDGHGTHVAGIAAAVSDNGSGGAGVSWGAQIMPVKVLDSGGLGSISNVAAGIVWAVDNGARVINLSLGGSSYSSILQQAVNYALARGVIIVAAAGNQNNSVIYPARFPGVIAVAATNQNNQRYYLSNYGNEVSIAAPGVGIYSTLRNGRYGTMTGTSMAAPFISGAAAILVGIRGNDYTVNSIIAYLTSTTLDLAPPGFDVYTGYGLLQLDAAVKAALPPTPTLTITDTPGLTPTPTITDTPGLTSTPAITLTATPTPTQATLFTSNLTPIAINHQQEGSNHTGSADEGMPPSAVFHQTANPPKMVSWASTELALLSIDLGPVQVGTDEVVAQGPAQPGSQNLELPSPIANQQGQPEMPQSSPGQLFLILGFGSIFSGLVLLVGVWKKYVKND